MTCAGHGTGNGRATKILPGLAVCAIPRCRVPRCKSDVLSYNLQIAQCKRELFAEVPCAAVNDTDNTTGNDTGSDFQNLAWRSPLVSYKV